MSKNVLANYKAYCLLLLVLLVVSLLPLVPLNNSAPRVQPILLEMANRQPESRVNVIVQKAAPTVNLNNAVTDLNGTVTSDLPIINGLTAELPAKAVPSLSVTPGVRWISLDATVFKSGDPIDTSNLQSAYIKTIRADKVWNEAPYQQGDGIGVAVLDSGINPQQELYTKMGVPRLVNMVAFNGGYNQTPYDGYGHGNHVAGIIGSNGSRSNGAYMGVAPMVNLINVKVSDDDGSSNASSVIRGMQWILDNYKQYNIRVVNISLNSSIAESYNTNPLCAAAEILWFNGIVVVVSAGNNGNSSSSSAILPPANDPFVITVGATDDKGTESISDDTLASFSAYGTSEGVSKPDLVAPGRNIVSLMANPDSKLAREHHANVVQNGYFRMSGTSMAAPMVSGAVALILQANAKLTPDQVKYRLKATARPFDTSQRAGAGYLDVYAAVKGTTTQNANTGIAASKLLWTGSSPVLWGSVSWNSVSWNSVSWNSVSWNSVSWNSVSWNSTYWDN